MGSEADSVYPTLRGDPLRSSLPRSSAGWRLWSRCRAAPAASNTPPVKPARATKYTFAAAGESEIQTPDIQATTPSNHKPTPV